jgi:hypothetical protein
VAAGETYEYRVQTAQDATVSAYSNVASVTIAPAAPSGLTALAVSGTRVDLSWTNVGGETGYRVDRYAGGVWTTIGATGADAVSFSDTSAVAGSTYYYRVRAFNAGGESPDSNYAAATTPNVLTRPTAPSSLVAVVNANRQVQLWWKDNSTNEKYFVVQRSTNNYSWTTLGSVPANSTGAIDTSALRGRTYYYRVFTYNDAGYSAASNSARVVTPYYAPLTSRATLAVRTAPVIQPLSIATPRPGVKTTATVATAAAKNVPAVATTAKPTLVASTSSDWTAGVDAVFAELSAASRR